MKAKLMVIDADSIAYRIAYYNQQTLLEKPEAIEGEFEGEEVDDMSGLTEINWAIQPVRETLDYWLKMNQCTDYELHLTAGERLRPHFEKVFKRNPRPNFRYAIAEDLAHGYKHNRTSEPLEGVVDVLEAMAVEFGAIMHDSWEADDAVTAMKRSDPDNILLTALDKDVLNQVEGVHFNYGKLEPHVTTSEYARFYCYLQALIGDPGDGYKGVPGVGIKKAEKLISPDMSEAQLWDAVVYQYKAAGLSEVEAKATMVLACMNQLKLPDGKLRLTQDEWFNLEFELWTPESVLEIA